MKLSPEEIERIANKEWREGENFSGFTEKVILAGVEVTRHFIRYENDDGELLVLRVRSVR